MRWRPGDLLGGHHLAHRPWRLAGLIALAFVLQLCAGVGVAYVAGFSQVWDALGNFVWPWVFAIVGGLVVSFVGYYYAYRAVYLVDGGPDLTRRQMRAAVITGFGGFFARGGGALDKYALEAAGADERDAKVRVSSLAGMEHGVLALVGEAAAIAVLIAGYKSPPADFSVPWAVIPLPGFLVAFWAANRYRDRFRGRGGWGAKLGVFLDSIYLIRDLFVQPRRYWRPLLGMAGFWLSEIFAGWAGLHAFGFGMNGATFIVGFGTGMVFTRRTGPLAGAGILALVLAVTVWYSGAPFGAAVAGIFAYRFLSLWLPMPVALATLPVLREMGHERVPGAEQKGEGLGEPALEERASA